MPPLGEDEGKVLGALMAAGMSGDSGLSEQEKESTKEKKTQRKRKRRRRRRQKDNKDIAQKEQSSGECQLGQGCGYTHLLKLVAYSSGTSDEEETDQKKVKLDLPLFLRG